MNLNADFIQYPSATATVSCAPLTGRCLPIHYITLDGRPLSPQNLEYITKDKAVPLKVAWGRLQYHEGAPTTVGIAAPRRKSGAIKPTGEITLKVAYPLRASVSSDITCPTVTTNRIPEPDELRVGPSAYTTTTDAKKKTGLFYLKACATTSSADEEKPLIELFPKRAKYTIDDDEDGDGSRTDTILEYVADDNRVRHYQNIEAKACGALGLTYTVEVVGEWNSTDCTSSQDEGVHADYYSFSLASPQEVQTSLTWANAILDPLPLPSGRERA